MKITTIVLLLGAMLVLAGTAHAYAIYNHSDQDACIVKSYSIFTCHFTADKHSTYNGKNGAGLDNIWVQWPKDNHCYTSDELSIPKGGYIRIYNHELKIYNHHDKHQKTMSISQVDCHEIIKTDTNQGQ